MNSSERTKYRRSVKWKKFRRKLIESVGHKCYICGVEKRGKQTRYLQVHHINPESYGHETENDVVVLCAKDHELVEKLLRRKNFDINEFCEKLKEIYWSTKNEGK